MIRTQFGDESHWDIEGAFLAVRRLGPRRWRASVAKLASDGEYSTVQRSTHRSKARAVSAGMRALRRVAEVRRG